MNHRPGLAPLALLLAGCVAPASRSQEGVPPAFADQREKEVVCVVERMPNYITHLTAVAGLPGRTLYADDYGHTVDTEGHQILLRNAPLLPRCHRGPGAVLRPPALLLAVERRVRPVRVHASRRRGYGFAQLRRHR